MILGALERIFQQIPPERLKELFLSVQIFLAIGVLAFIYFVSKSRSESNFRVREADLKRSKLPGTSSEKDRLAHAKMEIRKPLSLPGIRLDGEPHEILGIRPDSDVPEIQRAYRELMKRYHPDVVGRPGTREWSDAQKIAEAINRARNALLKAHSQSPKRSGR